MELRLFYFEGTIWNLTFQPLKVLYLHYQNAYGHHTWEDGDLPGGPSTHKSHDSLITWFCEVTWQTKNIYTTRVSMATKLDKMITYLDEFLSIKSQNCWIMWSCIITWPTKDVVSPPPQCLWSPNVVGWWLTLKGS